MARSKRPGAFLTDEEQARVEGAIAAAEKRTSGEIRVLISRKARGDVLAAARAALERLGMHRTAQRNAVLILLAVTSRQFAIVGDEGIHRVLGQEGWDRVRDGMEERFRRGAFADGLVHGVEEVAAVLERHFPWQEGDVNELPDTLLEE